MITGEDFTGQMTQPTIS